MATPMPSSLRGECACSPDGGWTLRLTPTDHDARLGDVIQHSTRGCVCTRIRRGVAPVAGAVAGDAGPWASRSTLEPEFCPSSSSDGIAVPMIPLGLKETKQLDWATPLKVGTGLELRGLGVSQASRSSLLIEPSETLRPGRKKGLTRSCQAPRLQGFRSSGLCALGRVSATGSLSRSESPAGRRPPPPVSPC